MRPELHNRWTSNIRYIIYFLRELTGPIIALYIMYILFGAAFRVQTTFIFSRSFFNVFTVITFIASMIHSLTWFWVSTQITPFKLKKPLQVLLFFVFLGAWGLVSYLIIHFNFYVSAY